MNRKFVAAVLVAGGILVFGAVGAGLMMIGTADRPVEYIVVKGDTLFVIARDHGVTVEQLREWNGISGDLIEVGQVLEIRTLAGAPDTPKVAKKSRKRKKIAASAVSAAEGTAEAPALVMPEAQACLSGPELDQLSEEEQMIGSAGLTTDQVRGAMNAFVSNTLSCISGADDFPEEALLMEITVGCDGVVSEVSVLDRGDWSGDVASCVSDVLTYAPFPAHDLPGGEVFQYPLRFTPG